MQVDILMEERAMLVAALDCHEAVIARRITKESNEDVKRIYACEHKHVGDLRNKLVALNFNEV